MLFFLRVHIPRRKEMDTGLILILGMSAFTMKVQLSIKLLVCFLLIFQSLTLWASDVDSLLQDPIYRKLLFDLGDELRTYSGVEVNEALLKRSAKHWEAF